jgi:adenine-specific DNA-methyltransferase
MIERMLQLSTDGSSKDIVMDFFAGSGTTGHAAYKLNSEDEGNRRFILVQLPEPIEDADARGFKNISELTKERLRRAGARAKGESASPSLDAGFRVFKLDTSNIRPWNPNPVDLPGSLFANLVHIEPGRSNDDVLYEVLLKLGLDLCVPMEQKQIVGKSVHSIGGGTLLACLDEHIGVADAESLALGMAQWRAEQGTATETTAVFRDSAFENDVAKSNLAAILQQHGIKHVRSL